MWGKENNAQFNFSNFYIVFSISKKTFINLLFLKR